MCDHQRTKREERREHDAELFVPAALQIGVEERTEERDERLGDTVCALGGCPAYSEEEVVDEERAHVIGRLAPFAPTPVQHGELDAVAEEKVPRMKIPVGLRKTVRAPAETPAPRHESTLECLALARCQEGEGMRIAVDDAHDALAVAHQLSDPSLVRRGL